MHFESKKELKVHENDWFIIRKSIEEKNLNNLRGNYF